MNKRTQRIVRSHNDGGQRCEKCNQFYDDGEVYELDDIYVCQSCYSQAVARHHEEEAQAGVL